MGKLHDYALTLDALDDPEPYLLEYSGLPGPRGNIELGLAAAQVCEPAQLRRWAALDARAAPTGGAEEFLAFCGVVGLGRSKGTRTRSPSCARTPTTLAGVSAKPWPWRFSTGAAGTSARWPRR